MTNKINPRILFALLVLGVFAFLVLNVRVGYAEPSAAPRATGYTIDWYTIDGGGAQDLAGGSYSLSGTIGQSDAGSQSGGAYNLNGGFWVDLFGYRLYLPLILK